MTRAEAHATIRASRVTVVDEDVHGIVIARGYERWRIYAGGGIAGNSRKWWLRRVRHWSQSPPVGPFMTKRALARALRAWQKLELP